VESSSNVWIKLYLEALLDCDFFVSLLNLITDPISEDLPKYSGYDVTNILSGDLVNLFLVGQVVVDLVRVLLAEQRDLLKSE